MSKASNKKVYELPEHSLAKIELYRTYLEIYLAVLANTSFKTIYILDLFAGEGRDINGNACSSIAAVEVLDEHYRLAQTKCNNVVLFLNDAGQSVIEKKVKKIDRVKRLAEEIPLPANVSIRYSDKDFSELIGSVIKRLDQLAAEEKALCFLDPFGYKYSKPEMLRELLKNGNTELLLFIPICFMHRFTAKAMKDQTFTEGKHIEEFISALFEDHLPDITTQVSFIKSIKNQFQTYLSIPYVDVTYIEKGKGQYFALYFFSRSKRGFQKMLESRWNLDEKNGHGFAVNHSASRPSLFENIDHEDYASVLLKKITAKKIMTNQEVFDFGLENNHLPKHTRKVLAEFKKNNIIDVISETGNPSPAYYLEDNHPNKIFIRKI
jgi:three-Cys-motif partner protein